MSCVCGHQSGGKPCGHGYETAFGPPSFYNENGNGQLEFYETIELGIVVLNDGASAASNISGTIATDNPLVTVDRVSVWIDAIAAGSTNTVDRAFEFSLNPEIEDLEPVIFLLNASDGMDS